MISSRNCSLALLISLSALFLNGLFSMANAQETTENEKKIPRGFIAGNILGSKGWYERRDDGQLVLYPTISMYGIYGMGNMGGMSETETMAHLKREVGQSTNFSKNSEGLYGMDGTANVDGHMYSSQGWYWIAPTGHLILRPADNDSKHSTIYHDSDNVSPDGEADNSMSGMDGMR